MKWTSLALASTLMVSPPCSPSARHSAGTIDETITRGLDPTSDGRKGVVTLRLKAKSFDAPFSWRLTITSNRREVFAMERRDERDA